jgi:DNA-directed RNA polymerase subunit RPC12/RpoP
LEVNCRSYPKSDYQSAIKELSESQKENKPFDVFIQSFYQTRCASCGKQIQADEYIWEKGMEYPSMVVYDCSECGDHYEHAPDDFDKNIIELVTRSPLYRALAIDRIAGMDHELKQDAQEVSASHLPRSLYIIVALFTKLDALTLNRERKKILQSLLISVMDSANSLWPMDQQNFRPRQLSTPTQFKEYNLWKVLVQTAEKGNQSHQRVRTVQYPDLPLPGEICIYPGRVRDLLNSQNSDAFDAVITVIPRPSQAFWKLSAAWAAWLLGQKESREFSRIMIRDRYDWSWHANALNSTFQVLNQKQKIVFGVFGLLSELEPPFLSCVIPSAHKAGWKLTGLAINPEDHVAEIHWEDNSESSPSTENIYRSIEKGAVSYLRHKGEPADYLEMTCCALLELESSSQLILEQYGNSVQTRLKTAFSNPVTFLHIGPGEQTLESGHWWLKNDPTCNQVFSDIVELETLKILNSQETVTADMIECRIRELYPLAFSEIREYIKQILYSYAILLPGESHHWKLKDKEAESNRLQDVQRQIARVIDLGKKLNCTIEGEHPIIWMDKFHKPIYKFYIYHHSAFIKDLLHEEHDDSQGVLLLPASRLDLLEYKEKEYPAMTRVLSEGWRIVKFRLMSRIMDNPLVTLDSFSGMLKTDPVENNPDQLFLF